MTALMNLFRSKPKPISSKATAMAFAYGDTVYKRDGVNQKLKEAVKAAIRSEKLTRK